MDAEQNKTIPKGRFAPTPSGELHAGNLMCALLAYLSAKRRGGKFVIRIEDLDEARCSREAAEKTIDLLKALGLESDEPIVFQSERGAFYRQQEAQLRNRARVYPCFCTRAELHAAEAPRLSDGGFLYAGACRHLTEEEIKAREKRRRPCYRVEVPDLCVKFTDAFAGEFVQNLKEECGDFMLRRSDGVYAYQFAVSVDDGDSGITEVVRGDDLLSSTPRQIWLMRLLGYTPPVYYHIPLVCDAAGRKLSKSEGDSAARLVEQYPRERILGYLAYSAGLIARKRSASLDELAECFSWENVRKEKLIFDRNQI